MKARIGLAGLNRPRRVGAIIEVEGVSGFPPVPGQPRQWRSRRKTTKYHKSLKTPAPGIEGKPKTGERDQEPAVVTGEAHAPGGHDTQQDEVEFPGGSKSAGGKYQDRQGGEKHGLSHGDDREIKDVW